MRKVKIIFLAVALLAGAGSLHAQYDTVVLRNDERAVPANDSSANPDATDVEEADTTEVTVNTDDTRIPVSLPTAADSSRVSLRPVSEERFREARSDDDFWYWNYKQKPRTVHESGKGVSFQVPPFLFWVVIGLAILGLLYLILRSMNVSVFARKSVALAEDSEPESAEDFFSRDFEAGVARALAAGDYRLAVRLRYLQVLRNLAERQIIQYRQGATNGVYVRQLSNTAYYIDFFAITRTFEYAWYGMMPVTRAAFDRMQQDIDHLQTRFA